MFIVTMTSDVYGSETFEYDTMREANSGIKRIKANARAINDGIKREFTIEESED